MAAQGTTETMGSAPSTLAGADAPVLLSIVMPCLNEAETLERCIVKAAGFLAAHGVAGEIVIGDNGSTDGSQAIAERCGARVVPVSVRGYGAALFYATKACRGRYIIMGDSDDSYDFSRLEPFLDKLEEGYDLVMGNRFMGGIQPGAMAWKNRYVGNPVLTSIGRVLFKSPARDFHCGIRGYSAAAFGRMDLQTTGMEFASEMVVKATLLGMRIAEVPTTLHPDGRSRPPHLRPWRDGWRHLRFMFLYSPRWLFLYPGLAMMVLGAAVGAWLVPQARRVGHVYLDAQTLLYAAVAVLIGFQAVNFSVFTKIYAIGQGLMPHDPKLNRMFRYVTLETGLMLGVALVALGCAGTFWTFAHWSLVSFGNLNSARTLRVIIPSILSLMLGSQVILSSFFLSVLGLRTRGLHLRDDA